MADDDKRYHSIAVDGWGSETATAVVVNTLQSRPGLVVQQLANGRVSVSRSHRPRWSLFRRTEAGEIVVADGPRGCVVTVPPVVGNDAVGALRDALTQPPGAPDLPPPPPAVEPDEAGGSDLDGRTVARSAIVVDEAVPPAVPIARLQFPAGTLTATPGESLVLGRDPTAPEGSRAQVVPGDASTVSKSHLLVSFDGEHVTVEDLHSKNGSSIEHQGQSRALAPGERVIAASGDRIEMGAAGFVVAIE